MNKAVYYCPAVTCFDRDRELDPEAQKNVYRHVLAGGIEGLIVMGSIGEFIYMSAEQKRQLADLAIADMKAFCCEPMPPVTEEQTEKIRALLAEVDTM